MYFFRFAKRKATVTITAKASATIIENQIPLIPSPPAASKINGRVRTAAVWNNSVRKNEIMADTGPLFSAVKKEEPKIANPVNKKAKEQYINAVFVISNRAGLYPTKACDIGTAKAREIPTIETEDSATITTLRFKSPFSSWELPAP